MTKKLIAKFNILCNAAPECQQNEKCILSRARIKLELFQPAILANITVGKEKDKHADIECVSLTAQTFPTAKQVLREAGSDKPKYKKNLESRHPKNKMAKPVARAWLEYLERAETNYWSGTAKNLRDQLDRAKYGLENSMPLFRKNKYYHYFAEKLVSFGIAMNSAVPFMQKAGWIVVQWTVPGVGYYYELRRKEAPKRKMVKPRVMNKDGSYRRK